MTGTMRQVATTAVAIVVVAWASSAAATESGATAQPALMAPDPRVRGGSQRIVAAIHDAVAGSQTLRNLIDQIDRTDGIVYVMEGTCKHGVRACLLLTMTLMGPNRVLWILVDPSKKDCDLMRSIGHELQHAVEVLSHHTIRSGSAMTLLYMKQGTAREGGHFETDAAMKAGDAVRVELRETVRKDCE